MANAILNFHFDYLNPSLMWKKTHKFKDMRCLNVPPEVMVRFVFMMSITPCAKMRVRNMIMDAGCTSTTSWLA